MKLSPRNWAAFLLVLFNLSALNAQIQPIPKTNPVSFNESCGFDHAHAQLMATDPVYAQKTEEFNNFLKNYSPSKVSNTTLRIPVVVHVMETGNALTDISDDQIRTSIKTLNEHYRNVNQVLSDVSDTVDLAVEFALAVRDPSGNCTNGIVRYDMTGDATYMSSGVFRSSAGISDATLKAYSVWNQTQYYNIWLVSEIDNNNGGSGIQGYAYFASSHGSSVDGAVILANNFMDGTSTTGIHEIGHALNLYHTFEGDGGGGSCPPNTNCNTQGDRVCDTPPHQRSNSDCNTNASNPCGGSTNDFIHNYMDYSSDNCQYEFTDGQRTRMIAALTTTRASFLESNGNMSLVPPTSPVVAFSASNRAVCLGQSIQFFDNSGCIPNTFLDSTYWNGITFNWTFTNGTNVYTSTLQNPIMTFPLAGAYDVALTVTNSSGSNVLAETSYIVVGNTPVAACTPSSTNVGNFAQTVNNVSFNTLSNSTSTTTNVAYTDFSCDANTVVTDGQTYPMDITIRAGGSGTEYTRVYIDYNNNGVFDASELVLSGNTGGTNTTVTVTANVTIPATAVQNTLLRMRVFGETFSDITTNERNCTSNFSVGDVEDYGVYILPSCIAPIVNSDPSANVICATENTTFTIAATGTANNYQWQVSTNGGGSWTSVSNNSTYSGATTATLTITNAGVALSGNQYRCVVTNTCGNDTSTGGLLTVNAVPVTSVANFSNVSTCGGSDGTIEIGGSATGTLTWTGTTSGSISTTLNYTITGLQEGNYTIDFTSSQGCAASQLVQLITSSSSPTQPTISTSGPTTFCEGGSVTLTSSYASGNTWSTGATSQSIVVSIGGSYSVTYTDGGGCSSTSNFTVVTVNATSAAPTITVNGNLDICPGSSVELVSSSASNNVWYTTETTNSIFVSTAGDFSVHYIDGNGCPSDESSIVTTTITNLGPLGVIPFNEGFTGATFVPTNWALVNNGGLATWQRSASVGLTPTAGNSMLFDNYSSDDRPNQDEVRLQALELTGIINAAMSFDVAYARYDASFSDGLEVLISNDCGANFTSLYSKSGTTLATAPDVTSAFTPSGAGEWRNEVIDLSAYDGQTGVILAFRNLAGYGNRLFIDNINITGTEVPVADFSASSTTICEGDMVTFTNLSSGAPTSYSWSFPGGSPVSSTATDPVVTYSTPGTYQVELTATNTAGSDTETKTGYIVVNGIPSAPIVNVTDNCGSSVLSTTGSGLIWSTTETTASITVPAGTYTVTQTVNGCTSSQGTGIATPLATTSGSESVTACDSYTWSANAQTYSIGGSYIATLTGTNGCDSIATLNLTINNSTSGSESITACDSYTWSANAQTYSIGGTYTATLTGTNGCDSIATLNLTINTSTSGSESVTACDSYTWSANAQTYTTSGAYTAVLTGTNGCDSTATLNLTINNSTSGSESVTACGSYTWSANAQTYSTSGTYTTVLTGANGCDSTATLNLTINNETSSSESVTACESYTWSANAQTYTTGGTYIAVLTGTNGCDSTVSLNLTINNATSGSESVSACGSYSWSANAQTYTASGSYTAVLTGSNGCDSTATLNLTINNATSGSESVTACDSYTWSANAQTYTTSGSYTAVLTGTNGCDSIATLNLTINNATSGSESVTACESYTWAANAQTYTSSGTYTALLPGTNGCDSTVTLNLTINTSTSGSETITACDSYTWSANAQTYSTSGTYTALLTGTNGCDSTATLNLTINNSTAGSESITACDSYTWSANAQTYTASGTYTAVLTGANGCDSTATLNLVINNSTSGSQAVTACDSYTWSANAQTYSTSGIYTAVLTGSNGCDSTATLNLTVNNSIVTSETITECITYTWPANGQTYTTSGSYTAVLSTTAGCDSTIVLDLTINNPTSGSESITACVDYTWPANGMTYSTDGTYTAVILGSNGCDSTATLNLTIATTLTSQETVSACGSYTWSANTQTYTTSGTYSTTLISANGCDSIVTLNLTINNATSGSESVTACGSYTWSANAQTYTTGGIYTAVLTGANGCDSTATLNLTINNATSGSESVTACGSYTWSANAQTYTASGTYTTVLTGANGCDSTATLNLTINNATSGSESVTECGSYTWSANAQTYSTSGTYTAVLTGANGCDSTATLNLTINAVPTITFDPLGTTCVNYDPIVLNATPGGGNYIGTGINGNQFDPAIAGIGSYDITYSYTDGNGCTNSAVSQITVDGCIGLEEIDLEVNVSPNPTDGVVKIDASSTLDDLQLYDYTGKLVRTYPNINNTVYTIDISDLSNGVYFGVFTSSSTSLKTRIVLNR